MSLAVPDGMRRRFNAASVSAPRTIWVPGRQEPFLHRKSDSRLSAFVHKSVRAGLSPLAEKSKVSFKYLRRSRKAEALCKDGALWLHESRGMTPDKVESLHPVAAVVPGLGMRQPCQLPIC
jgi:hypothetical protein